MTERSVEPASVEPAAVEAPPGPTDEPAGADKPAAVAAPVEADKPAAEGVAKEAPGEAERPVDHWEHFGPPPVTVPGRLTRIARRTGRILGHEWTLAVLGALLLAAAMHWRSLAHPTDTIPADLGDPTLQAWQLAWSGHAILTDPSHLWDANAFFPDKYSYAFSDTLLGYFPFGLFGNGPAAALVRYNILFVLLHALAFLGPYALVRQLGASRTAGALAGAAFAYAPWRWGQAGHMHVLSNGGMALALAMLARGHGYSFTRGFRKEEAKPAWAVAGWCMAAWQVSLGFGIGLPFAYLLGALAVVVGVVWAIRRVLGRPVPGRRVLIADAIGGVVFTGVAGFMAFPYLQVLKLHPEARRTLEEVALYSPNWKAFITAPAQSWLWGPAHEAARDAMTAPAETTLLPGFMLIGLAVAGLFFSIWSLRVRLGLLAGVVLSVILALGPNFLGGDFTYDLLFRYAPGWQGIRTPGRLAVWTTLLLAVLAAGAIGALVARSYELANERVPYRPSLLMRAGTLLPLVLVLVEGFPKVDHPPVPPQPVAIRDAVGPMVVLPSEPLFDMQVMLWTTTRFQPMVNGNSGFYPVDQAGTKDALKAFPDQGSVDLLHQLGVKTVVVVKNRVAGTDYAKAATPDPSVGQLGLTWRDDGQAIIFTLE